MIAHARVLLWIAIQLGLAFSAAFGALLGVAQGVFLGGFGLVLAYVFLRQAWRHRLDIDHNKRAAEITAALGIALFVGLLFSGLLLALAALLSTAVLALCWQMNRHERLYWVQVVAFVLLLLGASEARHGGYLVMMVLYSIVTAFTLAEMWLDRGSEAGQVLAVPPARKRLMVALWVMAAAFLFYVLMPRFPAGNLGGQMSSAGDFYHSEQWLNEAGQESSFDTLPFSSNSTASAPKTSATRPQSKADYQELREISKLSDTRSHQGDFNYGGFGDAFDINTTQSGGAANPFVVVARMQAPHGAYLKVRSFDQFDGVSWSSSDESIARKFATNFRGHVVLNPEREGTYQHSIEIEVPMPAWLPVASDPVVLWVPASVVALDQWQQPLLPNRLSQGTRYTVLSSLEWHDQRPVSFAPPATQNDYRLPDGFDPRIRRLAHEVTYDRRTAYEKAVALEQHLRSEYQYQLTSVFDSQGKTPLSRFLFEEKRGHCEYFASAMAIMLRSINIPSRLVTGFSAKTRNPLTGYYELRAIDGHAWVEAWIDNRWITFEPTAFYELPDTQVEPLTLQQINDYATRLLHNESASGEVTLVGAASQLWLWLMTVLVVVMAYVKWLVLTLWWLWVGLILLALGLWRTRKHWLKYALARLSAKRIREYQGQEVSSALYFYAFHLQRVAERHQVVRAPFHTVEYWQQQLETALTQTPALQAFAKLVVAQFYQNEALELSEVQATALAALAEVES